MIQRSGFRGPSDPISMGMPAFSNRNATTSAASPKCGTVELGRGEVAWIPHDLQSKTESFDPANLILSRSVGVFDAELASLQSMFEPHRRYGTDHCSEHFGVAATVIFFGSVSEP